MDKKAVKILAYYLPQFHSIPENDEWWGNGYTEWTTIKKENVISENLQPLDNNYYNLLDTNTVLWQTKLAQTYGIYGFIYYHYYFCGKKLLEKPAENLLNNKSINQKFCFCWANHDWNRSWEGKKTILIEQKYGNEENWLAHFLYLLPFFKDDRYIKIDGKPLFIIFSDFEEKQRLYHFFNEQAKKYLLDGIFFAETAFSLSLNIKNDSLYNANAIVLREPAVSLNGLFFIKKHARKFRNFILRFLNRPFIFKKYNSKKIVKRTINYAAVFCKKMKASGIKYWLGAYSGWNNTPRHGKRGFLITSISNENYIWYLTELKNIAEKEGIEFIFFNAWNEWAEGMILEPDTCNKYRYLEGIKQVFSNNN